MGTTMRAAATFAIILLSTSSRAVERLPGDVAGSGDGCFASNDLNFAIKVFLGASTPSEEQRAALDVVPNQEFLSNDLNRLVKFFLQTPGTAIAIPRCEEKAALCGARPWPGVHFQYVESRCDGIDNDCDNTTDENCGTGCTGCTIGGVCIPTGTLDSTGCRICTPQSNPNDWSNVTDTTPCTDSNLCDVNSCSAGVCAPTGNKCKFGEACAATSGTCTDLPRAQLVIGTHGLGTIFALEFTVQVDSSKYQGLPQVAGLPPSLAAPPSLLPPVAGSSLRSYRIAISSTTALPLASDVVVVEFPILTAAQPTLAEFTLSDERVATTSSGATSPKPLPYKYVKYRPAGAVVWQCPNYCTSRCGVNPCGGTCPACGVPSTCGEVRTCDCPANSCGGSCGNTCNASIGATCVSNQCKNPTTVDLVVKVKTGAGIQMASLTVEVPSAKFSSPVALAKFPVSWQGSSSATAAAGTLVLKGTAVSSDASAGVGVEVIRFPLVIATPATGVSSQDFVIKSSALSGSNFQPYPSGELTLVPEYK